MQWQAVLGDVRTLAEADNYLSMQIEVRNGDTLPAGEALRALFVSPDVAEFFRFTYQMRRGTFLDLINSFLRTPIHETLLDAFLMRCHDDGDLFTITFGGGVSYYRNGWELVDEMPVAGPKRKVRPVKPVGQDDLEKWLVKKKADFINPDPKKRSVLASVLGSRVRRSFPGLTPNKFMDSMHFFSQVGRLYNM
jgi:hypothetical protein